SSRPRKRKSIISDSPQKEFLGCRAGAATEGRPYRVFQCCGRRELRHDGLQTFGSSGPRRRKSIISVSTNIWVLRTQGVRLISRVSSCSVAKHAVLLLSSCSVAKHAVQLRRPSSRADHAVLLLSSRSAASMLSCCWRIGAPPSPREGLSPPLNSRSTF